MSYRGTVLVLGILGRTPYAGVAWQVLHYMEGLGRLGYDAYYVEDTGDWPYDADRNTVTADCTFTVNYIARMMRWCGFEDRWAYRAVSQEDRYLGMPESRVDELLNRADALINLTGATILREEHLRVPVRIYLESDPVLPQIEVAQERKFTIDFLGAHTHHFSFGENLGAADCGVPCVGFEYLPTRQPVVLDWWAPENGSAANRPFTTVASWQQSGKDIEWEGELYSWSKHLEFMKFIDLPSRSGQPFELALAGADEEATRLLTSHGWHVVDALTLSRDIEPYRRYIRDSRGEFTVAKDQNVRMRSGWFSDRSACYLAAGRPVITQETGFSKSLPTGRGLFAFSSMEDIIVALETIEQDYPGNCRAAREIASEHFAVEKVLANVMQRAGL